jgi:hypothetical protein
LAILLLLVSGGFAYAGKRLRTPLAITRPGGVAAGFMITIWLLAIYTVVIATHVYGLQVKQAYPGFVAARVRVGIHLCSGHVLHDSLPHARFSTRARRQCR